MFHSLPLLLLTSFITVVLSCAPHKPKRHNPPSHSEPPTTTTTTTTTPPPPPIPCDASLFPAWPIAECAVAYPIPRVCSDAIITTTAYTCTSGSKPVATGGPPTPMNKIFDNVKCDQTTGQWMYTDEQKLNTFGQSSIKDLLGTPFAPIRFGCVQ
ncbi:hypothetical protein PRIPAC_76720 [Pristionchus pacificus]|uniref:Uncharacterized protein n=1 Tax=Pristionchus pacificus TaxID=54126 RepID=A0A2A6C288_PRIPA|nr:hypothetical protein PRIPAC_76720 [Pristionchus pacificus]|eukprot:PDM72285.1 hypothetical protein PRIPAC_38719 [Pristionchus pacificus]